MLPNGDVYSGQYRHGRRHGTGLYVFCNGSRYSGQYRCDRRQGTGTMYYPDGSRYDGEWRRDQRHGHGRYTYANGDRYEGAWHHGQRHGVGTYSQQGQQACEQRSSWVMGQRNGPCEIRFAADAYRMHCLWRDAAPEQGRAVYTFDCQTMAVGYVVHVTQESGRTVPEWRLKYNDWYDRSLLPPAPMPPPLDDSDEDVCSYLTPPSSEDELQFDDLPIDDEEGGEDEGGDEIGGEELDGEEEQDHEPR